MPPIGQSEEPAAGTPLRPFVQRSGGGLMSGRRETPDGAGIGRSYGELYVEYAPAARGLALSMVPPDVADDIVAEAFARVLAAIRGGRRTRSCVPPVPARGRAQPGERLDSRPAPGDGDRGPG